ERLHDDVLFIALHLGHVAALDELDNPTRIEVHAETDAAAILRKVLDGQAQATRAAGAEHQPVGTLGKELVGQCGAEGFVIGAKIVNVDAGLGDSSGTTSFKNIYGLVCIRFRNPPANGSTAQPFVFEEAKLR